MKYLCILLMTVVLLGAVVLPLPLLAQEVTPAAYSSDYNPSQLSYGLYWFGAAQTAKKFEPGQNNPYFDPARPTLIFVHGWQPDLSYLCPPDFRYDDCDQYNAGSVDTIQQWLDDGWNVGIFYWNQFSDEPSDVQYAEAKIWTATGPQQMRWRKWQNAFSSTYEEAPAGTPSAAELFFEAYRAALTEQDYTGGNIRVAGHSLGNQMAVRLAWLAEEAIEAGDLPAKLRPDRVVLLDPYWSNGPKSYLDGKSTGQQVGEYVEALLPKGILFEWYWSSSLTVSGADMTGQDSTPGYTNNELKPLMLYAEMDPAFVSGQMSKHQAAWNLYFWSYAFDGPAPCSGEACQQMTKLLAKMSDDQLAAAMQSNYRWAQNAGSLTPTPDDDTFQSSLAANAPYTATQMTASPSVQYPGWPVTLTVTIVDNSQARPGEAVLVTFGANSDQIPPRAVASDGTAQFQFTSYNSGTVTITATTGGAGSAGQVTTTVTFSGVLQSTYLPVAVKNP